MFILGCIVILIIFISIIIKINKNSDNDDLWYNKLINKKLLEKKQNNVDNFEIYDNQLNKKIVINDRRYTSNKFPWIKNEQIKTWDELSEEYSKKLKQSYDDLEKNIQNNKSLNGLSKQYSTIKTESYEDLLKRPEWYNYRDSIITKRGYHCEWCNYNHNLQIHHKCYYKLPNGKFIKPWEYNENVVLLLCDKCHKKAHEKYQIKTYFIKGYS